MLGCICTPVARPAPASRTYLFLVTLTRLIRKASPLTTLGLPHPMLVFKGSKAVLPREASALEAGTFWTGSCVSHRHLAGPSVLLE